jgi:hypothetical protein
MSGFSEFQPYPSATSGSIAMGVALALRTEKRDAANKCTKLDPREEYYWIESPHVGLQLFLRRQVGLIRIRSCRPRSFDGGDGVIAGL